jgi:tryptophanase
MQNIKDVSALCRKYGVMPVFDAARFAENAYFIKTREPQYKEKGIREIVKEMFSYVDGATMSSKKDAIVNIGGFIALRDREVFDKAAVFKYYV